MTRKIKRYSEAFRRQVVAEYEAGESIHSLQQRYGIRGATTIPRWVQKYGREGLRHEVVHIQTAEVANRVKELENRVKDLEQALGKISLEKIVLESMLEEYQDTFGELAKKNAPPSSSAPTPKPTKQTGSREA